MLLHTQDAYHQQIASNKYIRRNYALDFLKLIFTLLVFFCHTSIFVGENTNIRMPPLLGGVCVHFFFVVSGMLMIKSLLKYSNNNECGKNALEFTVKKFKGILPEYWIALFLAFCIYIYIYIGRDQKHVFNELLKFLPEIFALQCGGTFCYVNGLTWYISCMLICMLPMAYICLRNRDFYIHVFAPVTAIVLFSYLIKTFDYSFGEIYDLNGFLVNGVLRATCGICFGAVSYLIYQKVAKTVTTQKQRIIVTIIELLIWGIFFNALLFMYDKKVIICTTFLLVPIGIALTFAGKGYLANLFKAKWMRCFSSLSLAIYLCHGPARRIVNDLFPGNSYKLSVVLMGGFTIAICGTYYFLCFCIKKCSAKIKSKG